MTQTNILYFQVDVRERDRKKAKQNNVKGVTLKVPIEWEGLGLKKGGSVIIDGSGFPCIIANIIHWSRFSGLHEHSNDFSVIHFTESLEYVMDLLNCESGDWEPLEF